MGRISVITEKAYNLRIAVYCTYVAEIPLPIDWIIVQRIVRVALSTLTVVAAVVAGFATVPSAQAAPEDNYVDAPQLSHSEWDTCPNLHYIHVAEWTYCLDGNVKGKGDSGSWYWNDAEKTLTFDNFVLERKDFTGSYGAGTFVEVVFDRSKVGVEQLNVKFRGNNVIDQQSKGHSDAIALMFTMKSGGVNSKQDGLNPKVNLIGESADVTLTVNTDMSTDDPNYSTAVESWGAPLTIGGQGTINLNPGYSGDKGFAGAMGISASTFTITDDVKVNIKSQIANPETTSTEFGVLGTYGSAVLAGNSQLDIDVMGVTGGNAIGMYSRENITVTEQASLKVKADSPNMAPVGVRADKDTVFSSAKDADIQAPGGRVWYAGKVATFEGPGDVNGTGASKFSLQAAGDVTMAKGYGVFAPESGKVNNPGVINADGERVSEWQLSILKPLYELVETSPAKAVESPMKGEEYAKQGVRHEYSAPATVEVNGKTWQVETDASTGQLTVTPAADAVKGDRAEIPVTVTYYQADSVVKTREAIAPVVVSEASAAPQPPTVQDMNDVPEGSWQEVVIPSYGPDENGTPNPLDGMFKYDVTYVNNDGEPFNPDDPVSRGKKAVVTVSLTDKGKESYTSLKCPEGATCEVNGDGNVVFTVDLAFKPKPESPDETKPSDETKKPSATSKAQRGHGGLGKTGSADMTLLGASVLLLLAGGCLLKRRHM